MTPNQQVATLNAAVCEVAFDNPTRQAYATDASIYQCFPAGVACPKTADDVAIIIEMAREEGLSVIARGGGFAIARKRRADFFHRLRRDRAVEHFARFHLARFLES